MRREPDAASSCATRPSAFETTPRRTAGAQRGQHRAGAGRGDPPQVPLACSASSSARPRRAARAPSPAALEHVAK